MKVALIIALIIVFIYLLSFADTFRWAWRDEKKHGGKITTKDVLYILRWTLLMSAIRLIWMKPKIDEMRGLT